MRCNHKNHEEVQQFTCSLYVVVQSCEKRYSQYDSSEQSSSLRHSLFASALIVKHAALQHGPAVGLQTHKEVTTI